jgi:hypothetical protein
MKVNLLSLLKNFLRESGRIRCSLLSPLKQERGPGRRVEVDVASEKYYSLLAINREVEPFQKIMALPERNFLITLVAPAYRKYEESR